MTQGFLIATPFVLFFLMDFGEKAFLHLKKFILEVSQVSFICIANQPYKKSYLNAPTASNSMATVARKGTPNLQCNKCKYIFSSHYICRDHDNGTNVQLEDPNFLLLMQKGV